jgi:O-methyltransferase involved in polyketide biosynthesis
VFEVDHPATQALKEELVWRLRLKSGGGATFVPVDFEVDDLGDSLLAAGLDPARPVFVSWLNVTLAAGLDPARPVFVSWLNVTVYLSQDAVSKTLAAVGALSAPKSELLLDFCGEELLQLEDDGVARMVRTAGALGEPIGSGLPPAWVRETLSALGYGDIRIQCPEDLAGLRAAAERNGYHFMPACYIATARKT